jgi:membrane-bound metal-dependent hydrolase YbcI (DUF457 family)
MLLAKRISSIAFALAFLTGIVVFTGYGRSFIPYSTAQFLFILFGAVGLITNLISFQQGKHAPMYSFAFWSASLVLFTGFIFRLMHWPFATYIMIFGMVALGATFIIPAERKEESKENEDLLDQ